MAASLIKHNEKRLLWSILFQLMISAFSLLVYVHIRSQYGPKHKEKCQKVPKQKLTDNTNLQWRSTPAPASSSSPPGSDSRPRPDRLRSRNERRDSSPSSYRGQHSRPRWWRPAGQPPGRVEGLCSCNSSARSC